MDVSYAELRKHNLPTDSWVALRGKVYDVTGFMDKHPGGPYLLRLCAGREATNVFEAYHSLKVYPLVQKHCKFIGTLTDCETPVFPETSEFYASLKEKVENHFKNKGIDPKVHYMTILRMILTFFGCFAMFYLSVWCIMNDMAFLAYFIHITIYPSLMAHMGLVNLHDAGHACALKSPLLWRLIGSTFDFATGGSHYSWYHQHFLGHHPYTNTLDARVGNKNGCGESIDPDCLTSHPVDFRRIKHHQPLATQYQYQHIYAPLVYGLLSTKFRIDDVIMFFFHRINGVIEMNPPDMLDTVLFVAGKLFCLTYRVIIPTYYIGLQHTLLLWLVSDLVISYYLSLSFQVNHLMPETKWPRVDQKTGLVNYDWAKAQIATSLDYAHDSPLTTWLTGALNFQVVHHLFPGVSQGWLPEIAPIVRAHCKEHGVHYNYLPTFWDALLNHFEYLRQMGQRGINAIDLKLE